MTRIGLVLLSAALAFPAAAQDDFRAGDITVARPWARATPPGAGAGGVYMALSTKGGADRLVKAESAVAERVELHTMSMEGGVMKMREIGVVDVKPGAATELKPGGLHVMLLGLKKPLAEGQRFPLTLHFEKAGRIEVQVAVGKAGAAMHGHHK
jgi:copper(I)-binding protein